MLRIVAIAGLALLGLPFGVRAGEPEGTAGPPTAGAAVAVEFAVITDNGRAITPS